MHKCRGKRIDNGEWAYGYYAEIMGPGGDTVYLILSTDTSYFLHEHGWFIEDSTEVYPDSVVMFTGLKDKNAVEIYQHDKLRCCIRFDRITGEEDFVEFTVRQACGCFLFPNGQVYIDGIAQVEVVKE